MKASKFIFHGLLMTFVRAHIYLYFICCRFCFLFFFFILTIACRFFFGICTKCVLWEALHTDTHLGRRNIISRQRPFIHVIPKSYTSHLFWIILNGLCREKSLRVYAEEGFSSLLLLLLLLLLFVSFFVLIVAHLVCIAISQKACNNNTEKNESHFKFSTNVSLYLKWAFGAFFPSKFTVQNINNEWNIMRWNPHPETKKKVERQCNSNNNTPD